MTPYLIVPLIALGLLLTALLLEGLAAQRHNRRVAQAEALVLPVDLTGEDLDWVMHHIGLFKEPEPARAIAPHRGALTGTGTEADPFRSGGKLPGDFLQKGDRWQVFVDGVVVQTWQCDCAGRVSMLGAPGFAYLSDSRSVTHGPDDATIISTAHPESVRRIDPVDIIRPGTAIHSALNPGMFGGIR